MPLTFNQIIQSKIKKFNPFHDNLGRFATSDGFASMTIATKDPKKQHWADKAIERHKERQGSGKKGVFEEPKNVQREHPGGKFEGGDRVQQDLNVSGKDAQRMAKAISDFSMTDYPKIRHAQRGDVDDPEMKAKADAIEEFIEKSPQWRGGTLYRGVKMGEEAYQKLLKAPDDGTVIDMKGVSSFSSSKSVSDKFIQHNVSPGVKRVMFVTENPGKATSIRHLSEFPDEDEVLCSYDNKFKVTRVVEKSINVFGKTETYLEAHIELHSVAGKAVQKSAGSSKAFNIMKADTDKRLVFGWASIARRVDGEQLVDLQRDMIDPEDLEEAVYKYVLEFRDAGEEHIPSMRKKASLVESVMFTKEKMKAMGIPEGIVPEGWWIGFYVKDDDAWERIKNGTYKMFSIEGQAIRVPVEKALRNFDEFPEISMWYEENMDATEEDKEAAREYYEEKKKQVEKSEPVAKTFSDILKFNPWHDRLGRFTSGDGFMASGYSGDKAKQAVTFSANPKTKAGAMAIARHSDGETGHEVIGGAFGTKKPAANPKKPKPKPNPNNDPDEIAGAKRGEPMTREQANEGSVNPNFNKGGGYWINCQSCVVAFEARLRGFDVRTAPKTSDAAKTLSHFTNKAWKDPKTGETPDFITSEKATTAKRCKAWMDDTVKAGQRFTFEHQWRGHNSGHIISVDKDSSGNLRLYDPQSGKTYMGSQIDQYLSRVKFSMKFAGLTIPLAKLMRVDDKEFNMDLVNDIMEAN